MALELTSKKELRVDMMAAIGAARTKPASQEGVAARMVAGMAWSAVASSGVRARPTTPMRMMAGIKQQDIEPDEEHGALQ